MRGGTHASTYTNLSPHSDTYARDTCKFSSDSDVLVAFLRRNPDLCTLGSSTPLDVPLTGVARHSSLLFCVCLGHRVIVKPCWFTSWGTILPGFTSTGRFPPYTGTEPSPLG